MKRIARFEKVSFEQFKKDYESIFGNSDNVLDIYENIKLPKRATKGSAGHDFFAPFSFVLKHKVLIYKILKKAFFYHQKRIQKTLYISALKYTTKHNNLNNSNI